MSFTRLTNDLNIIQALPDDPNDTGGLSAQELKAEFDKSPNLIKSYINTVLLTALEAASAAGNIGISTIDGIDTATTVQAALAAIMEALQGITQGAVADGSITTGKLASGAVVTAKIADDAVTADKMADNAVGTAVISALAVTAAKLAEGSVETAKLATGAVTSDKLGSGAVVTAKIADGAVNSDKLGAYSVNAGKLASNAIEAEKIKNGAVSAAWSGTLASANWTGDSAPFSQVVTCSGMLDTDEPIVDLVPSSTYSTAQNEDEAWGNIYRAVTGAGTLTFYTKVKPSIALNFKARSVRK